MKQAPCSPYGKSVVARFAKLTLLLFVVSWAACAEPIVNDETSDSPARDPSDRYALRVRAEPHGTTVLAVRAQALGVAYPMASIGPNYYGGRITAPPCAGVLTYHFEVDYQRPDDTAIYTKREPEIGGHTLRIGSGEAPADCAAPAGTYVTVNSTVDMVDADLADGRCAAIDGRCTLRAAVMHTNLMPGHDIIFVPEGTYVLSLTGSEPADVPDASVGDLDISDGVSIVGAWGPSAILDGNRSSRLFDVHLISDGFVHLEMLVLRNGREAGPGGAILNRAPLSVSYVMVRDNLLVSSSAGCSGSPRSCPRGGAIYNEGALELFRSTLERNHTCPPTVYGCGLDGEGGAIFNAGSSARLVIRSSTFVGNTARMVGGIYNRGGSVQITNSTFDENTGNWAGTLGNYEGSMVVNSATIRQTSGVSILSNNAKHVFAVNNSVITADHASASTRACVGTLTFGNSNFVYRTQPSDDPMRSCTVSGLAPVVGRFSVDPIGFNGGFTQTIRVRNGLTTDAVNPIDSNGGGCPYDDQHGQRRPVDGDGDGVSACDSGAVENWG